ncbi:MAG: hypothetical protein IJ769_12330, partial [Clostridia bacterium]|nr:hypothetical protein [Clostridia bacterium]
HLMHELLHLGIQIRLCFAPDILAPPVRQRHSLGKVNLRKIQEKKRSAKSASGLPAYAAFEPSALIL